ncbi:MAG: APC family permease [Frankiaceae bacterium]
MAEAAAAAPSGRLSALQGTALYVGVVLGTGVIALPALAADVAGPASLLAWLGLAILSAPLAATFAALGARHPDAGGVASYAGLAFGERAAAIVGWCFFFSVPVGAPAAALWAGGYVAGATGGGRATVDATAVAMLIAAPLVNAFGVQLTGRVQLGLAGLLLAFLLVAVGLSLPHARLANLHPFAPHGWAAIGPAATKLVWSFVGWEAVTYLTAEFRRPRRDVPRATAAAVAVVGVVYLAVAFATVAVLGPGAGASVAPLGDLMAVGLGGSARTLAAVTAVLLTLGVLNTYYAGASKLGAALARDGSFPLWLARGSRSGEVPRRSLGFLGALALVALVAAILTDAGTGPLVLLTTGLFVAVYAVGVAAAVRLLPRRSRARAAAWVALVAVLALLVMAGSYLIWPLVVTGGALLYRRLRPRLPMPA